MKAPEMLLIRFLAICIALNVLGTSAWTQTEATYTQGSYFTFRMEQLKQELRLTPVQERQLKPIVEQETSELMQHACNPVTSRNYKLTQFSEIFRRSESSMRPLLRAEQYQRLVELRQGMVQEFKTRTPDDSCTMVYWRRKSVYK